MTPDDGLSEAELDAIAERVARKLDDDREAAAPGEAEVAEALPDEADVAEALPDEATDSAADGDPDPAAAAARERAAEDAVAAAEAARRDLAETEAAVDDAGDDVERTVAASLADVERQVAADLAALDPLDVGADPVPDDGRAFEARLDAEGRVELPDGALAALEMDPGDPVRVVLSPPEE
jgi:hypothetical protein